MTEHRITLRIPAAEWAEVQKRAQAERCSANQWIGRAVTTALELSEPLAPIRDAAVEIVVVCSEQQARAIRSAARAEMRTPELYLLAAGLDRGKEPSHADK